MIVVEQEVCVCVIIFLVKISLTKLLQSPGDAIAAHFQMENRIDQDFPNSGKTPGPTSGTRANCWWVTKSF